MSQAPAQVKMSESGALGDSIPNCNTAILAVTSCNAAMRLVELVELDFLCFFCVASCQVLFWNPLRHFQTQSPGPGGCDCQKVSVPSKYEKKTRTWMICVKGTFSSQESGKEMQRATRLESVHHSQETEIMHYYYSILHDPASSIFGKAHSARA